MSKQPCCPTPAETDTAPCRGPGEAPYVIGQVTTWSGSVPRVATQLTRADRAGTRKARWAIGRMRFRVEPGLYAVGEADSESPIFVTANYKMSFDRLRAQLDGRAGWVLVLDTQGINVWCAAGKGTFGTEELCARIEAAQLADVVSHRRLILPQLGAPGVAAHLVKKRTGFRVTYGPIRAEDLPAYLDADMKATPEMRRKRFPFGERVALIPVELVLALRAMAVAVGMVALAAIVRIALGNESAPAEGAVQAGIVVGAILGGVALPPALLPWLPGRAFALKGLCVGIALDALLFVIARPHMNLFGGWLGLGAWGLFLPAAASFFAMTFTGSSTYTSPSGVRKEMRVAVPLQALALAGAVILWILSLVR